MSEVIRNVLMFNKYTQQVLLLMILFKRNKRIFFAKKPSEVRIFLSEESDNRYRGLKLAREYCGKDITYIDMPTSYFNPLYQRYMKTFVKKDRRHNCDLYHSKGVAYQKSLAKLHDSLELSLKILNFFVSPDIFISASLGDARWKHLCKISKETIGVPWLVTEREGVISPRVFEKNPISVANQFSPFVDYMSVSNERHKEYWEKIEIPSERLKIVGELKSDLWFDKKIKPKQDIHPKLDPNKKLVLYFAFGRRNYIEANYFPNENYTWDKLIDEHILGIKEISKQKNVQIVIKGGHSGDLQKLISKSLESEIGNSSVLPLGPSYNAIDLMKVADVFIGMQTTGVIEAQFTNVPIIYSGWGDLHDQLYDNYLLPLKDGDVIVPRNVDDFVAKVIECLEDDNFHPDDSKRKIFREKYFYQADGKAFQRLLEYIFEIIKL